MQHPSIAIDGSNEKISHGLVKFYSDDSRSLLWVCKLDRSHFLVFESNKYTVSFLGLTMSKFIWNTLF